MYLCIGVPSLMVDHFISSSIASLFYSIATDNYILRINAQTRCAYKINDNYLRPSGYKERESNRTKVICENQNIIVLGLDILYCYQV